jgi:cell division protein FtsB
VAKRPPRRRPRIRLRWIAVALLCLTAFLYWRPVANYVETRASVERRRAEVSRLRAEKVRLERQLAASTSPEALAREARRLGMIEPGQHLFVVKGVRRWLREREARTAGR